MIKNIKVNLKMFSFRSQIIRHHDVFYALNFYALYIAEHLYANLFVIFVLDLIFEMTVFFYMTHIGINKA